ncbi:UDP-N-acetylmuramoyl-tripeptide--D-alanyl-D-alanine ligase [Planococcus halotolerans]|uniref:UDP-N-acetylmuramoyl-tripeptide--D-alanyl-D-alanine ligase n=1 Tax=Planococcus halotolerans TaxID=2233542 RepID=A0A365KRM3_9BACL|nr:UDP-N-acetylmuramoyl-tripeptide--D-alanyl-D-alanine ligase [Planococcus halotolerans]QHJ69258.1 UDP-N-acetylmuramoyl-tripeptide--D-alanyl-D-alanine ligase [Planococcus halotolerans]RAZ75765.1 UDP-N-acetylmuramoyl-tripeptide--D-alanyl-D-alanine ligase [Planococcus halotolerans]
MKKTIEQVAKWLDVKTNLKGIEITGVSINTRTLKAGDLFVPFRGEKVNGHLYVRHAIEAGAAAALWQRDEPSPPDDLPILIVDDCQKALQEMARAYRDELAVTVIGITGSNGKTSTKDLVASVLKPYFKVQKTQGNFNNELGLPLTILSLEEDTKFAVLEMGMSGFGQIQFLSELARPDYAVITNIGEAHMQDLGSREGIAQAKFEITAGLETHGKLFYDGDEPLLKPFVENFPQAVSFGFDDNNELTVTDIRATENGSTFMVSGIIDATFTIPVLGQHQVKNTLSAILIALEAGLTEEDIRKSLKDAALTDMRMQMIPAKDGATFINDAYNAAPSSMKAALNFIRETTMKEDKWVVLGDMLELGDQEREYHEAIEKSINSEINGVCLYGPRMEWLYTKLQDSFEGKLIWSKDDYQPIIDFLGKSISAKSVILVKGSRGMALENIIEPFTED